MKNDTKRKKRNRRRNVILILVAVVALAGTLFFLFTHKKKDVPMDARLVAVQRGPLEERISASGSFQAERWTTAASRTIGNIKKILVRPGDRVSAGDVIAEVDERDARSALVSAQINLEEVHRTMAAELATLRSTYRKDELALDQARRTAERAEKLRAVDGVSGEDLRKAKEELDAAEFAFADAKERLAAAQGRGSDSKTPGAICLDSSRDEEFIQASPSYRRAAISRDDATRALEGCVIRAEEDGTVTKVAVSVGDALELGTLIARIEDLSSIVAEVNVDEVDIGKIDIGMDADISADSLLGKTLRGKVLRIWPIVKNEGNGRVCLVQLSVDFAGERALSGATCVARITARLKDETLIIPAQALIPGADPSAVWVATREKDEDPYTVTRKEIGIGASTASKIEVLSGLDEGDLVATEHVDSLKEGAQIQDGGAADDPAGKHL